MTPVELIRVHRTGVDSTMLEARRLLAAHAAAAARSPLLVTADEQTAGRGRRGRAWSSPVGGVWMTLVWPAVATDEAGIPRDAMWHEPLPLVVALALVDAIEPLLMKPFAPVGPRDLTIKWPNDILLRDHKLSGVLCERVHEAGEWLLIGVGVNAAFAASALGDLGRPVTSLQDALNEPIDAAGLRESVVRCLLDELRAFDREGFTPAHHAALASRLAWRGEVIEMRTADGAMVAHGSILGVDDRGRLVLSTDRGHRAFNAGEVHRLRRA